MPLSTSRRILDHYFKLRTLTTVQLSDSTKKYTVLTLYRLQKAVLFTEIMKCFITGKKS